MTTSDIEYAELYRQVSAIVDVRKLEHCDLCAEPLYLIYKRPDGKRVRKYCYWCDLALGHLKNSVSRETLLVAAG
jgi:hypothetical protein